MKNSNSVSIEELRRKGLLGCLTASKEEIFGLKGSLLVTCRQSGLSLDAWKEALRVTLRELESVRRRKKEN